MKLLDKIVQMYSMLNVRRNANKVNWNPLTDTLANREDPDEMQHNAAFYQGLHCLLRLKQHSGTENHHNLDTYLCPLKYKILYLLFQYIWEIHQKTRVNASCCKTVRNALHPTFTCIETK